MALHEANRVKLAEMMPKGSRGVALLQGGDQQTRYDTDHEPVFRQESYFQYLFGVSEAGCFGAVSLPRSAHALHCLCTLWTLSACSGTLRGPCLRALHAPHRPCTVSALSLHPRRTLSAPSPQCARHALRAGARRRVRGLLRPLPVARGLQGGLRRGGGARAARAALPLPLASRPPSLSTSPPPGAPSARAPRVARRAAGR